MKTVQKIFMALVILTAFNAEAITYQFDADCLNRKAKFSDCRLLINSDAVHVEYKSKAGRALNTTIPADRITALSAGEYSRRRVAEAIFLNVFAVFSKKKRDQIAIEYLDDAGKKQVLFFQVKKKYGLPVRSQLQAVSGKVVQMEDSDDSKW